MNINDKIAVCSRSFSKNLALRTALLERYRSVTFNDTGLHLEGHGLVEFLRGHTKAIVALETINEYVLAHLPELQVISKYGVGLDMIDMEAMRRYGKRLGWTGGVNRRSAAELALAFMIMMLRHVPAASREVQAGTWRQHIGGLLTDRCVGIIGCGNIGKDLVKLLQPFRCGVIVYDICDYSDFYAEYKIEPVSLEKLLMRADVVSLHVPLDFTTRDLLTKERLSLMKSTSILVNVARGGLVDELALKEALKLRTISAAAFDVFADEPPHDQELLCLPNFLATPHIGGGAEEAILAMGKAAIDGLDLHKSLIK